MNSDNSYNSVWKNFDSIVCICLASRNDRYIEEKKIFDDLGIPVIFYRPEKHVNGGVQGCFESHIKIITDCYNKGLNNVLIFEDDATPSSKYNIGSISECVSFMKTNKDWDLLFLGSNVQSGYGVEKTSYPNIFKSRFLNAHSYVVSRKGMEKYANLKYISQIDVVYSSNSNSYTFLPSIFIQRLSTSDISNNENYMGLKNTTTHKLFQLINNNYAVYVGVNGKFILELLMICIVILMYYNPKQKGLLLVMFLLVMVIYKFINWVGYLQYNH